MNAADMGSKVCCREIAHLEGYGRLTALIPIHKHKNSSTCRGLNYPLAILSLFIIITQSVWDWDNLDLSTVKRTSGRIHAAIFYIAIWFSSTFGRIALLLAAPLCYSFFEDVKAYVRDYIQIPPGKKSTTGRYKVTCLVILNFIYVVQMIEFIVREFVPKPSDLTRHQQPCKRFLLSCDSKLVISAVSILFKFLSSASLYYLTYFVIVLSDLLCQILASFETDLLARLGFMTFVPDRLFIINDGGQFGKKRLLKDEALVRRTDIQEQFSRLKALFAKFNMSVGPSLCVSFLADILIMICIAFSLIPNLTKDLSKNYVIPDLNPNASGAGISFLREEDHGIFLTDAIHYVFGILNECRAVLLASIGSYLKYKVEELKERLETKDVEGQGMVRKVGSFLQNSEARIEALELRKRVGKWTWELRCLDMITVDLTLIPTMLGTIMTYVVVLLQIRLSEPSDS